MKKTVKMWIWWFLLGLVVVMILTYPIRSRFFPEYQGKLTLKQEFVVFLLSWTTTTVFFVRPFCLCARTKVEEEEDDENDE